MPDDGTKGRGPVRALEAALERFLGDLPRFIYVEPTNACNLKCTMCPTGRGEIAAPRGRMKLDLYRSILEGARGAEPADTLFLHKDGEPLLNPDIFDMVAMAREYGIARKVAFATNATLLDENASREAIESGLDELYVSIESLDPEKYARIRGGGDLNTVIENISRFMEIKGGRGKGPALVITTINMGCSAPDVMEIFRQWNNAADRVQVVERYGWAGRYNDDLPGKRAVRSRPCAGLWYLAAVTWKGEVDLCCLDAGSAYPVADLAAETLPQTWRGEKYRELRRLHLEGKFDRIPICRGCVDGDIPWIENALEEIKKAGG